MARAKQVRTYADMQTIVRKLEDVRRESSGPAFEYRAREIISATGDGKDAWGSSFVLFTRSNEDRLDYVLVSPGSDGFLDFAPDEYFDLDSSRIDGKYKRDIVFRNGIAVADAGK